MTYQLIAVKARGAFPGAAKPFGAKPAAAGPASGVMPAAAPGVPSGQPGNPDQTDPNADPTAEPVAQHEWAGDVDETGDETDPKDSFAAFTGQEGESAWLDRSDDGTLTGWVKDADGTVYRYSDCNAWAVDVDDAQMTRTDPGQVDPAAVDPNADPAATDQATVDDTGDNGMTDPTDLFGGKQGKSLIAAMRA